MKKITIKKTKNIKNLEFVFPQSKGVYLIVGPNGVGKTTLLVCIDRICNKNALQEDLAHREVLEKLINTQKLKLHMT